MIVQFIYTSTAAQVFGDKELRHLLAHAVAANRKTGITGLLLYAASTFMQVFEGEPEAADSLMRRIKVDPRHRNVNVLVRNQRIARDFSQWHMGFRRLGSRDVKALPGYAPFFEDGFDPTRIGAEADFALEIMHALSEMTTTPGNPPDAS